MYLKLEIFRRKYGEIKIFRDFNETFLNSEFILYTNRVVDEKDIYGMEILNK